MKRWATSCDDSLSANEKKKLFQNFTDKHTVQNEALSLASFCSRRSGAGFVRTLSSTRRQPAR